MFVYYTYNFYNEYMYIKIKNPTHYALLAQLATLIVFLAIILAVIIFITLSAGSITVVWKEALEFFNYVKQKKGIIPAGLCAVGIPLIPVAILVGLVEWWKKRPQWTTPDDVYALDFSQEGVTVYTRRDTRFLPYKETDFRITAELVTVRTKNGSHAALNALTLIFLSQGNNITVSHKIMTTKLLYQLADLHRYFQTFAFNCNRSSAHDTDQQKLAVFLEEQIQNQIGYGLHRRYRNHLIMTLCGLLFMVLGIGIVWLAFTFDNPFKTFIGGIFLLQGIGFLTSGIGLLYSVIKDQRTVRLLKRLHGK